MTKNNNNTIKLLFNISMISILAYMFYIYIYVPKNIQKFSDLGAIIQLQTSRPYEYVNFIPSNQNMYNDNDVLQSYGIPNNREIIGTRQYNKYIINI